MKEIQEKIIDILYDASNPLTEEELQAQSGLEADALFSLITPMLEDGTLYRTRKGLLTLPMLQGYISGTYRATTGSAAFITPDMDDEDFYVDENHRMGAMDGDRVYAKPERSYGGDVRIVKIIHRAHTRITGVYHRVNGGSFVEPIEPKLKLNLTIPEGKEQNAFEGALVVARIDKYPTQENDGHGCIEEVLGLRGETTAEYRAILSTKDISTEFPAAVLKEAEEIGTEIRPEDLRGRLDLRELLTFTIDGADAKDLDDAVSLEETSEGLRLGVHIADVSHYVQAGTELDREASERGTSVYLPGSVTPMLPERLSNGICSLNPRQDRLTMTCLMTLNEAGEVIDYQISPSIIRTYARLTYDEVNALIEENDETAFAQKPAVVPVLKKMDILRNKRNALREERGAIELNIKETEIQLDAQGAPKEISLRIQGKAQNLIEEFMLMANETVARHLREQQIPCVYRVHDAPDSDRMRSLEVFLYHLGFKGIRLRGTVKPIQLQQVLSAIQGTPYENIISAILLRSMKKALYTTEPRGHFGLATEDYCHFTSPIRRYPDLLVHRMIRYSAQPGGKEERDVLSAQLEELAEQSSERERAAMEAERDADDYLMARFMKNHVGEDYEGIISGVTEHGFFVELENLAEGFVNARSLPGWYEFDERNYCLRLKDSDIRYSLGDRIKVIVSSVDVEKRKIDFDVLQPKKQAKQRNTGTPAYLRRKSRRRR